MLSAPSSPPPVREFPPLPLGWRTPPVPHRLAAATVAVAVVWGLAQGLLVVAAPGEAERRAAGAVGAAAFGESLYGTTAVVFFVVQVTALVVCGLWVRRSQVFARHLGPGPSPRHGGAWPWFAWVLPVVSYWFPYQMLRDLRGTTLSVRDGGTVGGWWATWVALAVVDNPLMGSALAVQLRTPGAFVAREVVLTVLTGFALLLWIGIVREITRAQRARAVA